MATSPAPAVAAQTLTGRVLEEGREVPVGGAVVMLLDAKGDEHTSTIADSLGRYRLAPPEAGEYVVRAVRLGYEASTSPLLAMGVEGEVPFDLLVRPLPVGLEGFEVTVEGGVRESLDEVARRLLGPFGHTPEDLDERWIDRTEIEKAPINWGLASIILSQSIAGVSAGGVREESICVQFRRVRVSGRGFDACALTVLNGAVVPREVAGAVASHEIEAIAVLTPTDATTFYGTQAGAGAVLIWTRSGSGTGGVR